MIEEQKNVSMNNRVDSRKNVLPLESRELFRVDPRLKQRMDDIFSTFPIKRIPALPEGDCFFDAVAQGLTANSIPIPEELKSLPPHKVLRMLCRSYAIKNKKNEDGSENWLIETLQRDGDNYDHYIVNVQFTAPEIVVEWKEKRTNRSTAMWGRPHIEGRIFCELFNIKLHVLELQEVEGDLVSVHQMYHPDGRSETVEANSINYDDPKLIHVAVHSLHFVPMIKSEPLVNEEKRNVDMIAGITYPLNFSGNQKNSVSLFKPQKAADLSRSLVPVDEYNPDYFKRKIDEWIEKLFLFVDSLADEKSVLAQKNKLYYMLNRIDLLMLNLVYFFLQKNPKALLLPENISFFVTNAIFLKKTKEALDIKREAGDFAHSLVDYLWKKLIPVLKGVVRDDVLATYNRPMRVRSQSFSRLRTSSAETIELLRDIFSDKAAMARLLFKGSLMNLKSFSDDINKRYLLGEALNRTCSGIFESIKYRTQIEEYTIQLMCRDHKTKCASIVASANNELRELEAVGEIFIADLESELGVDNLASDEQKMILRILDEQSAKNSLNTPELDEMKLLKDISFDSDGEDSEGSAAPNDRSENLSSHS